MGDNKVINMAGLIPRQKILISRALSCARQLSTSTRKLAGQENNDEPVTHTGQQYALDDYRRARFVDKEKLVNPNWAIKLVAEDPVVVCSQRVVFSDGGGPLGHPRVYINLDPPGEHTCGYSGRRFVHKRYYDKAKMGPSITYEQYLEQVKSEQKNYPV